MADLNKQELLFETKDVRVIDASGKMVFPSFVDSHTHLVYPASREIEYIDKIKGLSYEEIARRGGGILNSALLMQQASKEELELAIYNIRMQLNPHPAEQITLNIPTIDGEKLMGLQHKYRETALFFPTQGQTCHSYCTFCFRWPQFINLDNQKFASKRKLTF